MGKSKKKKSSTIISSTNTTTNTSTKPNTVAYAAIATASPITPIDSMQLHPIVPLFLPEHILFLPYLLDFRASTNPTLTSALLAEQNLGDRYEELFKLLGGHGGGNHNNKHLQHDRRPDIDARLKHAHDEISEASTRVTREVTRHYRQCAGRMHPDKHGEGVREQFEAFTAARDVLRDLGSRQLYIKQMVSVVHKVGKHYVESSHRSWVGTNARGEEMDLRGLVRHNVGGG